MKQSNEFYTSIIGITGGIATGKSTVTEFIREKGFIVIDADKISRDVVEVGMPAYKNIVKTFGKSIINDDLDINRKKLGEIIFSNEKKRKKLNSIMHSRVIQQMIHNINNYNGKEKVIFLDIPLLIEFLEDFKNEGLHLDYIWLVYTSLEIQLERLMKRNSFKKENAMKRINSQMKIEDKVGYADIIINNSKDVKHLKKLINGLLHQFL